ncbi:hypothetical protein BK709_04820 [Bacillus thuringiensis serovar shandongiensis]|uniref:DUF3775 domain-containing protein n=1 Tax=Bacillus toyonensis TaxID=155322 RepID=UPI000B455079|nr:DUF3775 domain-containing protein [Bacillus toyonensis]MEC2390240.1 DUF3775 domain-containing protein [Bacillus toyonensis]OTX32060.1 hypothetical protein BK717_20170 [Bacillus thuringiensis serovar malayensis]OUB10831.1 hypothetical protein BK709_04820 [Bacillus thuringiensis serovar shandongiensis]
MLGEMNVILKGVIKLARDRRLFYEQLDKGDSGSSPQDIIDFSKSPEGQELAKKEELLENYLKELDFDTVKNIQTIMYLGRDKDYNKEDTPEEIYRKEREYFDSQGWNSQDIEINKIVEKAPLDKYLEDGLEILKITTLK